MAIHMVANHSESGSKILRIKETDAANLFQCNITSNFVVCAALIAGNLGAKLGGQFIRLDDLWQICATTEADEDQWVFGKTGSKTLFYLGLSWSRLV